MTATSIHIHRVIRSLATAIGLCATTALLAVWLSISPAKADEMGSFNETGQYQYHQYSTPLRPAPGQPGYETERRANELQASEAERWRQEALRQERQRQYAAPPVNPNPYNFPEAVIPPNGNTMLCQKSFHTTICR